jgi:hypothetical protein
VRESYSTHRPSRETYKGTVPRETTMAIEAKMQRQEPIAIAELEKLGLSRVPEAK